jgi:hypothetical protein
MQEGLVSMTIAALVGVSLLISVGMWYIRRRHIRAMPDIGDEEFGAAFKARFGIEPMDAVAERRQIARLIGVAPEKLSPDLAFNRLVAGQFDVGSQVGLGHLEDDWMGLVKQAGAVPQPLPATVAELVRLRLDLKARRQRSK